MDIRRLIFKKQTKKRQQKLPFLLFRIVVSFLRGDVLFRRLHRFVVRCRFGVLLAKEHQPEEEESADQQEGRDRPAKNHPARKKCGDE